MSDQERIDGAAGVDGRERPQGQGGVDDPTRLKDPDDWTTGDEPMTGAQASYLETLSREAGVQMDLALTKAQASKRIDELQEMTGRGREGRS